MERLLTSKILHGPNLSVLPILINIRYINYYTCIKRINTIQWISHMEKGKVTLQLNMMSFQVIMGLYDRGCG